MELSLDLAERRFDEFEGEKAPPSVGDSWRPPLWRRRGGGGGGVRGPLCEVARRRQCRLTELEVDRLSHSRDPDRTEVNLAPKSCQCEKKI